MAEFVPLNSAEENNETSWYTAMAAGLASGILKVPEGIVSLGAELIDLGADTNTVADVEKFFDKLNPFEEVAEERAIGKITEALVSIGVPGAAGFRTGTKLAQKALDAKKAGAYAKFGKESMQAASEVTKLNKKFGRRKFVSGIIGGAAGEGLVADVEGIGTFGDLFNGPTALDRDETYGRQDATRRLLNRLKFGTESVFVTPLVFGAGKAAKALAQRGKELAYSDSTFERWVNKYIGAPLRPRGDLPEEVFLSEMQKQGLISGDTLKAKEIVDNITKSIDSIFPDASKVFGKASTKERDEFLKKLNETLFEGNLADPINARKIDELVDLFNDVNVSKQTKQNILLGVNDARSEFTKLIGILDNKAEGVKLKEGVKNLQTILKDRVQNWIGNSYRIFEDRRGIFKTFKRYEPTDEAYNNAINLFRRYLSKTDSQRKKDAAGNVIPLDIKGSDYYEQAKFMVDDIIEQTQKKKKAGVLPDVTYQDATMQGVKTKSFQTMLEKTGGKGSKIFRELFGEIKDPRYSIYNAMTGLSAIARTAIYFDDIAAKNRQVQAEGGRGFFWDTAELGRQAVNSPTTGIQIVNLENELIKAGFTGLRYVDNEVLNKYTTKEIVDGILNANEISGGLAGFVRGRNATSSAEKAASWTYRNLLLFPKGISQIAKTVLSVPTHLRNFFSAGAFAGANGILFEPKFYNEDFKKGIDISGILKFGPNSRQAQEAYRELLELGVVNSQVQIGDLMGLLKDIRFGENLSNVDTVLGRFMKKFKQLGRFAQGKYVAEDDTWKIANYTTELHRIKRARAKQAGQTIDEFEKTLSPDDLKLLKREAAEIVKNTVPNYAYVGSAVKTARLLPIGNFMSFPSEMIRTTGGIAQQALKEMRHSKPTRGSNITPYVIDAETGQLVKNDNIMYRTGMTRLTGMATTLTVVPATVAEGAKALYNVTEDEIEALREFVPEWSKNSTLVPIRSDDGDLKYIDFSHSNAYDVIARPFRTLLNNVMEGQQTDKILLDGFVAGLSEAGAEIMNPFISESIWTEAAADIIVRGGRTSDGRVLYTDQTSAGDKASIVFLHLGNALAPSYKQFQRIGQASFGIPTKRGDELEIGSELAGFMGLRPIKIDPLQSMGFKIAEYQTGIRNARREFTGGFFGLLKGGRVTPNDIIDRFYKSNKARFDIQQSMNKTINAAETLGVSSNSLNREFKERQISSGTYNNLRTGRFEPYYPSLDIQRRFREIALNLGEPNPFLEAAPILREMQRDMRQIDLDENFNLNLGDYIIETPSIAESLGLGNIGQPPMPSAQVLQPQASGANIMASGLTPIENALLSDEEKQIRLRQRGLA
jgi:hypothetical protein